MFTHYIILFAALCASVVIAVCLSGCGSKSKVQEKYMMKNCIESALSTSAGEPVSACEKQVEFKD